MTNIALEDSLIKKTDNDDQIQINRKNALKNIINVHCDGSVKIFSQRTGKHPTYVYGMLRDIDEKNQIKITTKISRYI